MTNQEFAQKTGLEVPADFNPFNEASDQELVKAYWKAHWEQNPGAAELYDED